MRIVKYICTIFWAISLMSCGGGNGEEQNQADTSLSGTWFFVSESEAGPLEYQGEHIIEQRGNAVEVTFCDRNTISLERENNDLYFNGAPFYLTVVDSNTLSGIGDNGSVSIVEKVSDWTKFQDGSFQLSSTQVNDFNHNTNVCASLQKGRFGCFNNPEVYPDTLTVTTDYNGSHVELFIAFKDIIVGTYDVVDFCTFVNGVSNQVHVDLESPEFESFLGPNRVLSIESGSISVMSTDATEFIVSGLLVSSEGYEFTFSVLVDLTKPDYA